MALYIQLLVYGIQLGSVYALLALGYTMVYGIVGMINFAHGDFLMIGAMGTYFLVQGFLSFINGDVLPVIVSLLIILIAMFGTGVLGVAVETIAYKPLRERPRISALITAVGVSMFLQNFPRALPVIGPQPRSFPTLLPVHVIRIGGIQISSTQIIMIVLSVFMMLILDVTVQKSLIGKRMRAVSQDKDAASLMGININQVISITFFIGAALAAASGIFYASVYPQIDVYMGGWLGTKSFIAAVLGGIGNVRGAMLGGFIMGISEILATSINSNLGYGIGFVILIVILLVKPTGLLGETIVEKV